MGDEKDVQGVAMHEFVMLLEDIADGELPMHVAQDLARRVLAGEAIFRDASLPITEKPPPSKSRTVYGPWRFRLRRTEDATGISGMGYVADGVRFYDGTCALRWTTTHRSTAVYESHDTLMLVHGHGGMTVCDWIDTPPSEGFEHGVQNLIQDDCENAAFASIGGLAARMNPSLPAWLTPARDAKYDDEYGREYLRGYTEAARARYGEDWRTCAFGWGPALVIPAAAERGLR